MALNFCVAIGDESERKSECVFYVTISITFISKKKLKLVTFQPLVELMVFYMHQLAQYQYVPSR